MKSMLSRLYWGRLASPAGERVLYRAVMKTPPTRIVEIGLGDCRRADRIIRLSKECGASDIRYIGIDLFEARPDGVRGVGLKEAYKSLVALGADVKLIPGEAGMVLPRISNALQQNDLLLIDACGAAQDMERGWFYLPRMLAGNATVFEAVTSGADKVWKQLSLGEIHSRGANQDKSRGRQAPAKRAA